MNIETLRDYCLQKPATEETMPFGDDTLVFKVGGKIFLLISLKEANRFNVKCDPELAIQLRESYSEVQPGFHMNKTHWNTVYFDGSLTEKQLLEMIDHSYNLIVKSLPKKMQEALPKKGW
ncbi:MAG: MmcQ/YjbR family DNA-binding protein [Mucilaginibacter sp.]|uniref:MmcQ/YjbR family DNA-binding protein n=1 Tax=Mucilaginibacter sp. TaxID=1882438 RepID=UPI0034E4898F